MTDKQFWSYLGGYFDGEGCVGIDFTKEKRKDKLNNSNPTKGWYFFPAFSIETYDYEVLQNIKAFMDKQGIKCSKIKRKSVMTRTHHTKISQQIGWYGWDSSKQFAEKMLNYTVAKKKQFELFIELYNVWKNRKERIKCFNKPKWDIESFMEGIKIIDKMSLLKSRLIRSKYNTEFFKKEFNI